MLALCFLCLGLGVRVWPCHAMAWHGHWKTKIYTSINKVSSGFRQRPRRLSGLSGGGAARAPGGAQGGPGPGPGPGMDMPTGSAYPTYYIFYHISYVLFSTPYLLHLISYIIYVSLCYILYIFATHSISLTPYGLIGLRAQTMTLSLW